MAFKETMKDMGRKMVGQGPEVDFKNEVAKYAADHGVSPEDAQRDIFSDRLNKLQGETQRNGSINGSENFRNVEAALNETFGQQQLEQFRTDSEDPSIYRDVNLPPLDQRAFNKTSDYYKRKFEGQAPDYNVVNDSAENLQLINELLQRFSNDPALSSGASLEQVMRVRPDLGADLGKVLASQDLNSKHERMFGRDINLKQSLERLKVDGMESIETIFLKVAAEWLKKVFNGVLPYPTMRGVAQIAAATGKGLGQVTYAASKVLISAGRAAGSYLNTKRE